MLLVEFDWTITVDTNVYTFIGDTVNFVATVSIASTSVGD
jgi:hypothetical protein